MNDENGATPGTARLRIPEEYRSGFAKIIGLSDESFQELLTALEGESPALYYTEFSERVARKISSIALNDVREIIETLVSLYGVRDSLALEISEFAEVVRRAVEKDEELELSDEDHDRFGERLILVLGLGSLNATSKALDVLLEHEHTIHDARILTDLDRTELPRKLLRARRAKADPESLQQILRVLWEHDEQERAMARLENSAEAGDKVAFLEALERIEWQNRPPMDFVRAAQLALKVGAHLAARQISTEGVEHHDPELRKYARVLAPAKVISRNVPPDPARRANREWLEAHGGEYRGRWVAVRNGELLGVGKSLRELIEQVGSTEGVLLTRAN